jgi:hypothetical protein
VWCASSKSKAGTRRSLPIDNYLIIVTIITSVKTQFFVLLFTVYLPLLSIIYFSHLKLYNYLKWTFSAPSSTLSKKRERLSGKTTSEALTLKLSSQANSRT